MAQQKQVKGWFELPGRPGDRRFEDQLKGLDWLLDNCAGKTILDAGCAEGLIALELAKRGAGYVLGVELVPERVNLARKIASRRYLSTITNFDVGDMNTWRCGLREYDIVVGLAILHKLKNPSACARMLARAAISHVVFRLPPAGAPTITDRRSGNAPHDIGAVMVDEGFTLVEQINGHLGEWVGVWSRT